MALVLVVDDDLGTREVFTLALGDAGHHVRCAASAREAVTVARRLQPDLALVDLKLPDGDGIRVLRSIRQSSPHTIVVIITGFATTRAAVQAIQQGAADFLEKPIDVDTVLELASRARPARACAPALPEPAMHAVQRWVTIVVRTTELRDDPNTMARWARAIATSAGSIRAWCRAAHLPAKASLNFARMLRVVARFDGCSRISDLLNVVDTRTLLGLLKFGCATAPPHQLPMTMDEYLERQRWIIDPVVLREVRKALGAEGDTVAPPPPALLAVGAAEDNARH
ncbi:MAG: response regulator [Vicinamibacterales bacterium]